MSDNTFQKNQKDKMSKFKVARQDIAKHLKNGTMSFIIGAGFSKNISNKFLAWKELLHDMMVEMYKEERQTWHASDDDLIGKYGYLGIASDYVRRRGYHEAIDHYIEKRTPVLEKGDNGKMRLAEDGYVISDEVDVTTHRELLSLNARYIYTFNYDNALELYEDLIVTEKDTKEAKMLKKSIDDLSGRIKELTIKTSSSQGITSNNQAEYSESSHNTVPIIGSSQEDIKRLSAERAEKENELAKLKTSSSQKYYVVRNSRDISKSGQQPCIFKLHGSLKQSPDYGFDEDTHLQYIICQEDYDSYSKKHEAFVDLMRISLLREAFCIIGFSCDDPNFLLWMNWVKDIKDRSHDDEKLPKKYYINVDDEEVPKDKQLMLTNYGIEIINLSEIYDGKGNKQSRKQRLLKFFGDLKKFKESDNLWDNVNIKHRDPLNISNQVVEYDSDIVKREFERRLLFPYPVITKKVDEYTRGDILRMLSRYIDEQPDNSLNLRLVLLALSDNNMPFSQFKIDEGYLTKLRQEINADPDLLQKYSDYEELTAIAQGNIADNPMEHASKDVRNYTLILRSLMSFDFDDASSKLEEWKPTTAYAKLVKILLGSTFTDVNIMDNKVKEIAGELNTSDDNQLVYTAFDLLLRTRPSNTWSKDPNHIYNILVKDQREIFERNPRIIRWNDFIRTLHDDGFPEKQVEPLGNIVIRIGDNDRNVKPSIQLIMMLIKAGLFPFMNQQNLVSKEFWMKVVEMVYRMYPQYCILGTALYGEMDMSCRVAQLFTYTSDGTLLKELPTILVNILRGTRCKIFTNNDMALAQLRNSLFIFAQYFIKVVPYFSWLETYKELFDKNNWVEDDKRPFYKEDRNFAENALEYITDEEYCNEIISKCLNYDGGITDYQNRLIIAAGKGLKSLNRQNLGTLERWMKSEMTEVQSFVIFNLHGLLDKENFQRWLRRLPDNLLKNDVTLEATCSFVENPNEYLVKRLSSFAAQSLGLWANGIRTADGKTVSFSRERNLDIDEIDEHVNLTEGVVVTSYKKLKLSFNQIEAYAVKPSFELELKLNHWNRLIRSMSNFLKRHGEVLSSQDDYIVYRNKIESKLNELCGNRTIAERLVSTKDEDVENAIIDLFQAVQINGINDYAFEYHMLANTILQKSTKALQTCLNHFSWIIGEHTDFFIQHGFARVVKMILAMYAPYFTAAPCEEWTLEAEKDQVEQNMLRLCDWLKKQGEDIGDWKEYEQVYITC